MNNDRFRFKFRAWINDLGCFADGVDVYHDGSFNMWLDFDCGKNMIQPDKSDVLMQCTGLRDKNGVLIFEGDAWAIKKECVDGYGEATHGQYYQEKHIVRWSKNKAAFVIGFYIGDHLDETFSLDEYVSEDGVLDFVITNNIHENPELLEQ